MNELEHELFFEKRMTSSKEEEEIFKEG